MLAYGGLRPVLLQFWKRSSTRDEDGLNGYAAWLLVATGNGAEFRHASRILLKHLGRLLPGSLAPVQAVQYESTAPVRPVEDDRSEKAHFWVALTPPVEFDIIRTLVGNVHTTTPPPLPNKMRSHVRQLARFPALISPYPLIVR